MVTTSRYQKTPVYVSPVDMQRIADALGGKSKTVSVTLHASGIKRYPLPLTSKQKEKVKEKGSTRITLSQPQLLFIGGDRKEGGFLQFLVPLLAAGASALAGSLGTQLGSTAGKFIDRKVNGRGLIAPGRRLTLYGPRPIFSIC